METETSAENLQLSALPENPNDQEQVKGISELERLRQGIQEAQWRLNELELTRRGADPAG